MLFFTPHWPDAPDNIGALSTLRTGGTSAPPYADGSGAGGFNLGVHVGDAPEHVESNRRLLQTFLPGPPAWLTQVHGAAVIDAGAVLSMPGSAAIAPRADASFTRARASVCAILTADCLPVLFCDAGGAVVAAAHAGWRGLAAGVLRRTVANMRDAGAGEILAWLGPAIGARQFEVGFDVFNIFQDDAADAGQAQLCAAAFAPIPARPGKYLLDMVALARSQLQADGVQRIAGGDACTVSQPQRFYSYRRDGVTGRQASLIWRK